MSRLLLFILFFAIFLTFIVLNIDNKCDISLGFVAFTDTPVFLSSLFSFVLGMLFAVPLVFSLRKRPKKASSTEPAEISGGKKGRWHLKGKGNSSNDASANENKSENSSYGID